VSRLAVLVVLAVALTGCESQAEKDQKSKADYAAYTAEACEHAKGNVAMVENTRSIMNKPGKDTDGRSFTKTICAEAAKAAKALP
jgi:hypothetical protein